MKEDKSDVWKQIRQRLKIIGAWRQNSQNPKRKSVSGLLGWGDFSLCGHDTADADSVRQAEAGSLRGTFI